MNGQFVISLDFELHWGVFDVRTVESYKENLLQVQSVIPRLLELADSYDVRLTFSTVGFLFAEDKSMLKSYIPKQKPTYRNEQLNPYAIIDQIGADENDDPFHYASSLIKLIKNNKNHEIGTHTFSHYYCREEGQTIDQFNDDLKSAIAIAKTMDVELKSIVFPRNMVQSDSKDGIPYLDICKKHGITSYRGNEKSKIYDIYKTIPYHDNFLNRILRVADCYFNLTGQNTYDVQSINSDTSVINLPSSRFLRPHSKVLSLIEFLKVRRIKKSMQYAAKHNQLFHLWWHPHNFGSQMEKNFENLESIFKEYDTLKRNYNFKSETMTSLADKILSSHN